MIKISCIVFCALLLFSIGIIAGLCVGIDYGTKKTINKAIKATENIKKIKGDADDLIRDFKGLYVKP